MDLHKRIERALDGLATGPELHTAVQNAVAEVQAELDAKDAQIAEQRAEGEHARAVGASLLGMQAAENYLKVLARAEDVEAERDRLTETVAQVRALVEATTSALSAPPLECTNACFGGRCDCGKPFRAVAWNLDPAALLAVLDAAPSPNGEST